MRIVLWGQSCSERTDRQTDRQICMKNLIVSFRKLAQVSTKINVAGPQNNSVHTKCKATFAISQRRLEEVLGKTDRLPGSM